MVMRAVLTLLLATCGPAAAQELGKASLRGGVARRLQTAQAPTTQVPEDSTLVVPECSPGYIDITGGKAFRWTCAFYCEGGRNFATEACMCACLTREQIEKLGLNDTTTTSGLARSDGLLVTPKPDIEGSYSEPVEETPVGELHEGPIGPLAVPDNDGGYVANVASTSSTIAAAAMPPAYTNWQTWQTILLAMSGAFLIIVAMALVLVFAHRYGFFGAWVAETNNLDTHDWDIRLTPDKLSSLRRDSQLSEASRMSADAVSAMDHLEKLRQSGQANAKSVVDNHLGPLHMVHTPSGSSQPGEEQDAELPMQRRKSAPEQFKDAELPMQRRKSAPEQFKEHQLLAQRRISAPDQLEVPSPHGTKTSNPDLGPSVVLLASPEQLEVMRTPSKISNSSGRSLRGGEGQVSRRHSTGSAAPPIADMAKDRLATSWRASKDSTAASEGQHSQRSSASRSAQPEVPASPSRNGSKVSKAPSSQSRRGSKISQVHPSSQQTNLLV